MFYYGVKYNNRITPYSPPFETEDEALSWYQRKGIALEKMFDRVLIFHQIKPKQKV